MTVDEILAQREYLDRCGREWNLTDYWVDRATFDYVQMWLSPDRVATQDEMRLLIERDMHRDECGGGRLADCVQHPVPSVTRTATGEWGAYGALCSLSSSRHATFPAAMGAARALAVSK